MWKTGTGSQLASLKLRRTTILRIVGVLAVALSAAFAAGGIAASTANADHSPPAPAVDPTTECVTLFGPGHVGFKIDVVSEATLDGVYNDPNSSFSVTISNTNTTLHTFDYSSNIAANVHVKGGSDPIGNNYGPPPSTTGTGLHAPVNPNNGEFYGLSHITFCWIPAPDLTVDKTPDAQTINAGDDVVFTIQVDNAGPGTATAVGLADTLPGGTAGPWTIDSQPAGDPCSITAGVLTCLFGDMASGDSKTVTVKAPTDYDNCAVYDNTAQVDATNTPPDSDDGQVTCQTPDLTVDKTPDAQTINAGDDVVFTIQVDNAGPGTATAVGLADTLPGGTAGPWTIDSQPAGDPCSITAGVLTCLFGDMASGDSKTVTVKAPTDYDNCAVYDNTAQVDATNTPPDSDDGQVTCQTPDLTVDKTPDAQTINAGDDVVFTIQVDNAGPGTATAVGLADTLPGGTAGPWTIDSQPAGDPCSITAGVLTCLFGDMASGDSKTVTVKAPTDYDNCAVYDNTAQVDATNTPPDSDDGQVTCQTPDLTVDKTPDAQTINAGDDVVFTIQVDNAGPGTATAVGLADTLPGGTAGPWTIDSQPAGDPCSITAGVLTCLFGDMASGDSKTVTVKAPTDYDNCAVYDNTAQVDATNTPPDSDDGQVTCQTPDLTVDKTPDAQTINAGDDVVFTIQVDNAGPGTAKAVTLSDTLPGGVAGAWVEDPDNPDCTITGGNQLDCDFGDMASGDSKTVTVKAPTDIDNCGVYDNTATVSSTNAPDDSDDGQVTCEKSFLLVDKTPDSQTINAGEDVVFTIQVDNSGPGTALSVTLVDNLPGGVAGAWVEDPDNPDCEITGNKLTCDFGDMASGDSKTVTVKAPTDYDNCAVYDNTAQVTSDSGDGDVDDGQVTCQTPDLTVDKTPDAQTINAGEDVVFTIQVDNAGPGTAKAVTLSDTLPGGVAGAWVEDPDNPDCTITGGNQLDCDFGDMASGDSKTVTVKAPTDYDNCAVYDNTATVSSTNAPDDSDDGQVTCEKPGLVITKEGNGTIDAGQNIKFAIVVRNDGPGTAKGVVLNDTLPNRTAGGWSITSQPAGDPCSLSGRDLDCSFGDMAPGDSFRVVLKASTSAERCSTYDNTATATPTNGPPVSAEDEVDCKPRSPGLKLKKTVNRRKVLPGGKVRYKIWIRNTQRNSIARDLNVCDKIPPRMTVIQRGGGKFENGRLCWKIAELPFSKSWTTFTYKTRVDSDVPPGTRLRNVVTAGDKKAKKTVGVKNPGGVKGAGKKTPVTG